MPKLLACVLIFVLLNAAACSVNALSNAERSYQIEIIVFSHITAQGLHAEKWPWTPVNSLPSHNTIKLTVGNTAHFSALPRHYFILAPEQRLLNGNQRYQVLLHLAWRQHIAHTHHAQPIHIYGGNIYNRSGKLIGKAEYGQQAYTSQNVWQINGTITPTLIRYIDLKFNLLFAQPISSLPGADSFNNVQGRFAYFHLRQSRRMRTRELNYIGHPLYGVLVKIVPIA